MLGSLRTTAVLLAFLALTVISSALSLRSQQTGQAPHHSDSDLKEKSDKQKKKEEELRGQFPVVDYDAPDDLDPARLSKGKEKNKRFDKRNFVSEDPTPRATEFARIIEGYDVPALPTSQSGLIITGEVLSSRAYLSNDKSGIYTELTVRISEVIKNTLPGHPVPADVVMVQREGGIVRYNNGHQRLYHLAGEGMPMVGRQYALFLRTMEQAEDYYLLTAYELSQSGVTSVDASQQFMTYEGYETDAFLDLVRAAVKHPEQDLTTERRLK